VSASSAGVGKGSVFEVRLPIVAAQPSVEAAPAVEAPKELAARILVVDDNVDAADMLAELLRIGGHEVNVAYSGTSAIAEAASFVPDVVFLDIGLPDMSGYEAAVRIRALPDMATATLIALTGYGQERDRALALEAGFNEHVVKPIDYDKVLSLNLHGRTVR
jgi:CheY-like chemotaxis protein